MKFYGHADLQKNQLQNPALEVIETFPANPVLGQVVFKDSIVYIVVGFSNNLPVWVPLTREITSYAHTQTQSSSTWTVTHNLRAGTVSVQVFDSLKKAIIPDEIEIIDQNTVQVTLASAATGTVFVVSGSTEGNQKPVYSYEHTQSYALTTWVIDHGLGYEPDVRVFINDQEVQPASITHNTVNRTTITFSSQQTGVAKFI